MICTGLLFVVFVTWDQILSGVADAAHISDMSRTDKSWCSGQETFHKRLDAVEKRVEDIVNNLQTQVKSLLDKIEAPEWNLYDVTEGSKIDILDADSKKTP